MLFLIVIEFILDRYERVRWKWTRETGEKKRNVIIANESMERLERLVLWSSGVTI